MAADPYRDAETSKTGAESNDRSATSRRRLLATTAVGSVSAFAGCAETLAGDDDATDRLRVMVWSGNYADRFEDGLVSQWEAERDIDIELERGWDGILESIRNAPADDPPFDVTVAEGNFYYYGRQDDLFEPIDVDNISNADEIMDFFTEIRDPEYGMPVDGAPCTIIHRDDADVDPETWADLSAETVANSEGVGIDTGFWWYPMYAAAIGMSEEETAEEMYDETLHGDVLDRIEDWGIEEWASTGEDIWQAFENGVIDVAQWYYDQTAFDIDDYEGLSHTLPEQTTGWINNWCIVRGTDMHDEAEEFIDFLLDAEVQSEWAESHPMMFSNENIDYPAELEGDLPTTDEEARDIAFPNWSELAEHSDDLADEFSRMQQQS
ncbi:ABC transporter substrate-binding protein [Natronobacterium gregoryi]|uniref:Family 1 extracellular solute-binding protein n=2 Tax=Natronobacterium gregoryi TaxID=44930 RepID=L0AIS6_NATGS|nr:PotD/PotF family extracellular solute-binding protein [Natronobacterium gregoryi]AFZ73691.1 spermidine/putrescine-binding periplasmic protein [Natronobacterium gregoryi SP2]ELY67652.1 family 1 extracellular solute-binding protein [Natronobacterium gregoryi SP2]PLK19561.1 spermidine/putrescine ABC transporter substrate-binding protein [Natronobacterium gregoryi SP2]SFJ01308.1 spermidine/putrescine transport system substrate-binding protein [Natronobacterium gregoryi]